MGNYFDTETKEDRHMVIIKSLEARISTLESDKKDVEFHKKIRVKKVLLTDIQKQIKNHAFENKPPRVLKPKNKCKKESTLFSELSDAIHKRRNAIESEDALYTDFDYHINELESLWRV